MIDARAAATYNASVAGRLWRQEDLPPPLSLVPVFSPAGEAFAHLVSVFQIGHGLTVDGKLGTDSLAALRSTPAVPAAPGLDDDADEDSEDHLVVPVQTAPTSTGRTGVSNCLRVGGVSLALPREALAAGVSASNFVDDDEHHFESWKRRRACKWFVIHESVSMSAKSTIRTLEAKKRRSIRQGKNRGKGYPYGVQLIVAPDGHASCHADLLDETLTQASQLNGDSVACEFVNPYNPKWAKPPFDRVIPAPWWCWVPKEAEPLYTLPTPAQMVTAEYLARFLVDHLPDLPMAFPTAELGPRRGRIKDWRKPHRRKPGGAGIVAHRDFSSHADGRYILEHLMQKVSAVA